MKIIFLSLILIVGCASPEKKTKFSDKNMRLMIDPASISPENYARLQTALVQQEMWTVLDRSSGLEAIKKEQETLHRTSSDRYEDKEKWAQWGKLYGVGSIIVAHAQCFAKTKWWDPQGKSYYCSQFVNLVDANTGEVVVGVEGGEYVDSAEEPPTWHEVAQKLADAYPKYHEKRSYSERVQLYKKESEEAARRQKEIKVQKELNEK
jgi:hypothetical protein